MFGYQVVVAQVNIVRGLLFGIALMLIGCAGESPQTSAVDSAGRLQVALVTTTPSGAMIRLRGTFAIRRWSEAYEPVIAVLSTEENPEATELSTSLAPGNYAATLEDGWRLQHFRDGAWAFIDAQLREEPRQFAEVTAGNTTRLVYRFSGELAVETEPNGELAIGIDFTQEGVCGDGVVNPGEWCDQGASNGRPDSCDTSCAFVCYDEACPLRVYPLAEPGGSGRSWADPMSSIQAAIDVQGGLGGGEVWVTGGDFTIPSVSETVLLRLRTGVRLLGAFRGRETAASQRDPWSFRTNLRDEQYYSLDPEASLRGGAISIVNAYQVVIEGVEINSQYRPFEIVSSQSVTLRNVAFGPTATTHAGLIAGSSVRLERTLFDGSSIEATASSLGIDTSVFNQVGQTVITATDSRLSLTSVDTSGALRLLGTTDAFIVNSILRGPRWEGGVIEGVESASTPTRLTMVNTAVLGSSALTPVAVGSAYILNSVFANLETSGNGWSAAPRAAAVEAEELEIAASTFYRNRCFGAEPCDHHVSTSEASLIHNSLFTLPPPRDGETAPYAPIFGGPRLAGNCYTADEAAFNVDLAAPRVIPVVSPCPGAGDLAELEAAVQRLSVRTNQFALLPFAVVPSLEMYRNPYWWRLHVASERACGINSEQLDPGRHWSCNVGPREPVNGCASRESSIDATFEFLQNPEGTVTSSRAEAVSADGNVVLGDVSSNADGQPANTRAIWQTRWVPPTVIADAPAADPYRDVLNCDGSVAVFSDGNVPQRWTSEGLQPLAPEVDGYVTALSADGSVSVGARATATGTEAIRWADGQAVALGPLGSSEAFGIRWDGQSVFASATTCEDVSTCTQVSRWTPEGGAAPLFSSSPGSFVVSSDGKRMALSDGRAIGFWSEGLEGPTTQFNCRATCRVVKLSSTGRILLFEDGGVSYALGDSGIYPVRSLINRRKPLVPNMWDLKVRDMSDNGLVFVGYAQNFTSSETRAFRATVEPYAWDFGILND